MSKNKKEKAGSIYFDTTRKTWRCIYYVYESNTGKEIRKTKSFIMDDRNKKFAKNFLGGFKKFAQKFESYKTRKVKVKRWSK